MEEQIEKLIESFSQMPNMYQICRQENDYPKFSPAIPHKHKWNCIKEFKRERNRDTGDPIIVAYNFNGDRLIEFNSNSVNIFYSEKPEL